MGSQGQVVVIVPVSLGADEKSLRSVTERGVTELRVGLVTVAFSVKMALLAVGELSEPYRGVGSSFASAEVAVFEHLFAFRVKSPVVAFAYGNITTIVKCSYDSFYYPAAECVTDNPSDGAISRSKRVFLERCQRNMTFGRPEGIRCVRGV